MRGLPQRALRRVPHPMRSRGDLRYLRRWPGHVPHGPPARARVAPDDVDVVVGPDGGALADLSWCLIWRVQMHPLMMGSNGISARRARIGQIEDVWN